MRSELVLSIAYWVSIVVVALVLFLLVYILFLRALLLLKERRDRQLSRVWHPILLTGFRKNSEKFPRIAPIDRFSFLVLWNTWREKKDGDVETCSWMNKVAVATGIDRVARRWLGKRGIRKKLLAIVALGQLRDKSEWNRLCQVAVSEHALLSLAAVQAIGRIDPAAAVPIIVPLAIRRAGWPAAKVASIFKDIGPDFLSEPLSEAIMQSPDAELQRLIPYLETCHAAVALSVVHRILRQPHDDKVIGPCLNVMGKFHDGKSLKAVRGYLAHPRWHVRAHAATCLGKIGKTEDEDRLVKLLADPEWWVRYRAAQAIIELSAANMQRVRRLKDGLNDRYARNILEQAMAEKAWIQP